MPTANGTIIMTPYYTLHMYRRQMTFTGSVWLLWAIYFVDTPRICRG